MRVVVIAMALTALVGSGCGNPPHATNGKGGETRNTSASNNISANSVFGSVSIQQLANHCAGRVKLTQGMAAVNDTCFSGDTNVVLCTDATAANPVSCVPAPGKLTIAGAGADMISYARVR